MTEEERKTLLPNNRQMSAVFPSKVDPHEKHDQDWWGSDSGSSTGSYYSDSDSLKAEWESSIDANGELFYIESQSEVQKNKKIPDSEFDFPPLEFTRRRSIRAGKLMCLIKRKGSSRGSIKNKKFYNSECFNAEKRNRDVVGERNAASDHQVGKSFKITFWIDPGKRNKLGRRASTCEAFLGIIPGSSMDGTKAIVNGFVPQDDAGKFPEIKIGDWLRSVNSQDVTFQNLDNVLSSIVSPMNVTLGFQRLIANEETTKTTPINSLQQSPLVKQLVDKEQSANLMELLLKYHCGAIYMKVTGFTEIGSDMQGVMYNFPRGKSKNAASILSLTQGAFVTLHHMVPDVLGFQPVSTAVLVEGKTINITYHLFNDDLLLLAFPAEWCNELEALKFSSEVVRVINLTNKDTKKYFSAEANRLSLDHFFSLFFTRVVMKQPAVEKRPDFRCEFETTLPAAHFIHLPRDAQIQIDAALNEMEAMDYRDWNKDPMDCQRLYTILGSCLYHKNHLLSSHLPQEHFVQVHSFLRLNGLLDLISSEPVKTLVVWKNVNPSSNSQNDSGMKNDDFFVQDQCFLLVVGYDNDILAVLLESGGSTATLEENAGPDVFYVEEAQETLMHIQKIGIPTLVEKWISANARPEVAPFEEFSVVKTSTSIAENFLGFIKSPDSLSNTAKSSAGSIKYKSSHELIKRRSPEENVTKSGSINSLQTSEESLSQGTCAISELSDEAAPILGRRATREKMNVASKHSEDSDSDLDVYRNESQTSTMDIADIRENLLNQAEYISPKKLTTSKDKNNLYHYVHLDSLEGILLSSYIGEGLEKNAKFLTNFSKCAHVIHSMLQNTMRFKRILNQGIEKSVINKSLVAIKEHGVLFEWENVTFWVVGRLYASPQPKELYVCYEESAPQNLIEMVFRLNAMCT